MRTLALFVMLLLVVTAIADETEISQPTEPAPGTTKTAGAKDSLPEEREELPEGGGKDAVPTPSATNEADGNPAEGEATITSGARLVGGIVATITTFAYLF